MDAIKKLEIKDAKKREYLRDSLHRISDDEGKSIMEMQMGPDGLEKLTRLVNKDLLLEILYHVRKDED